MNITVPIDLQMLGWPDLIEILFFATAFYYIARWLNQDSQKKLLSYFYGYCAIALGAYTFELPTIGYTLFIFSPAIVTIFLLMHQTLLQKNMVSLKNLTSASVSESDWLSDLMRIGLSMLHNNKELLVLLEHTDALEGYLNCEYKLYAPAKADLLSLLVEHVAKPSTMLWLQSDGIIKGINAHWKATWHPASYKDQTAWLDDAIAYTSKNDALIIHINPVKHTCSIATAGTIIPDLTIDQAHRIIRKKINYSISIKKGYPHAIASKKDRMAQHLS